MSDDLTVGRINFLSNEPLQVSLGGTPFNKAHLDARAAEIKRLETALTEARAEIERQADWIRRLQTALMFWMPGVDIRLDDATRELAADDAKLLAGHSGPLDCSCWGDEILARAIAAESELSTLRARVREVVGGMLAHSCVADAGPDCKDEEDEAVERAARQLMEDLK